MKRIFSILLSLLLVFSLVACGGEEEVDNDVVVEETPVVEEPIEVIESEDLVVAYRFHYKTLDPVTSYSESLLANFNDGLIEHDKYGRTMPALASEWTDRIEGENHIWEFTIREGVNWYEYDGSVYAEVKAEDWVEAAKYMLHPKNAANSLTEWFKFIKGAENYNCSLQADLAETAGDEAPECTTTFAGYEYNTDFSQVGVKAEDGKVIYTLNQPAPYFISSVSQIAFYPIQGDYVQEMGPMFGADGQSILYNGAYFLTEDIKDSKMVLEKNPGYWDADHVYINKVTYTFIPEDAGTDWARLKFENGEIDVLHIEQADEIGWEQYVLGPNGTGSLDDPYDPRAFAEVDPSAMTFSHFWNWNRTDYTKSEKTEAEHANYKTALLNTDFRLGFLWGLDRTQALAGLTPDTPEEWLKNTYIQPGFAVDQNGKDYHDYFVEIFAESNNLSFEEAKLQLSPGQEGRNDTSRATEHFEKAKAELIAAGMSEADFPIKIDFIPNFDPTVYPYEMAYVEDFNSRFGEFAQFTIIEAVNMDEYFQLMYWVQSCDFYLLSGMTAEYADPYTFLSAYVIGGYQHNWNGFNTLPTDDVVRLIGEFDARVKEGDALWQTEKLDERFAAFAEAEYQLTYGEAIILPYYAMSGKQLQVSTIQPHTGMYSPFGLSSSKYKHVIVLEEPLTRAERDELIAEYEAEKAELLGE